MTTETAISSLTALVMKRVPDARVRKQLAPIVALLAVCTTQDAAVDALRGQLPDLPPTAATFNAAALITAHVVAGFGDLHLTSADLLEGTELEIGDDFVSDELHAAIDRGLQTGKTVPWRSLETQQQFEADAASAAEQRANQDAAKGPDEWAAEVRAAIARRAAGDVGAIFATEVLRAAEHVKRPAPDAFMRLHAEIVAATNKSTAKAWLEEYRRYERQLERGLKSGENTRGLSAEKSAIEIVKAESVQFTNKDGAAYVVVGEPKAKADADVAAVSSSPRRVLALSGEGFQNWLTSRLWTTCETVLSSQARSTINATIAAIAAESGDVREVYTRVASVDDKHYLDLGNDSWSVIEIDEDGWRVLPVSPVMFVRPGNMRSLPEPKEGGDVSKLWEFLNVHNADRIKVLSWLCSTLRSTETYPILAIQTKANSGKSTTTKLLRRMVDPSKKEMSRLPKNPDDIGVAALNNYFVCYDNIDSLSSAHQDTFCVVATGTALGGRKLYSNFEESSSGMIRRPILLNGINEFVTRTDLNSRSVIIGLPQFTGSKTDTQVDQTFLAAYPEALGGLLTTFSKALRLLPTIEKEYAGTEQARAVAFAYLGEAVSRVLGHEPGAFVVELKSEQDDTAAALASDDAVGEAVLLALASARVDSGQRVYSDYVSDLKDKLYPRDRVVENWPKTSKSFSNRVRQLADALVVHGVTVEFLPRDRVGVKIRFRQDQNSRDAYVRAHRERAATRDSTSTTTVRSEDTKAAIKQKAAALGVRPNVNVYPIARLH